MRCKLHQFAAIDERNHLHSGGEDDVVELVNLGMNGLEHVVRIRAFAQENDSGNYVVVVNDLSVVATNRPPKLAQTDLRTLCHSRNITDVQRRPILGFDHGVGDVAHVVRHADFTYVHLLQARLDEASSGVGVVVGELLLHLADAESVGDEFLRIDAHLILARRTAEAGDVHHVGDGLEILFDHPIFERLQFHHVILWIGAAQREEIDLSDGAPVGPHLRIDAGWQGDLRQPLQHAFPIPGVLGSVFKDQLQIGKPE